jgi:hypothetical protein
MIFGYRAVEIYVNVSHHVVTFICRLWKLPCMREVLPNFFVDRLVFIFL